MSQYDESEEQGSQKLKFQIRQILKLKKKVVKTKIILIMSQCDEFED